MTTLDEQLKDWKKIKTLCTSIRDIGDGRARKRKIEQLHYDVKQYYHTYKTRFDMTKSPK